MMDNRLPPLEDIEQAKAIIGELALEQAIQTCKETGMNDVQRVQAMGMNCGFFLPIEVANYIVLDIEEKLEGAES
jgi:hypothetical protein